MTSRHVHDGQPAAVRHQFQINTIDAVSMLTWNRITSAVRHLRNPVCRRRTLFRRHGTAPRRSISGITGTTVQVPTLIGTYMIKAVNGFGMKSLEATSIFTNIGSIAGMNAIETISEHNTSPVIRRRQDRHVEVDGAALQLATRSPAASSRKACMSSTMTSTSARLYTSRITPIIDVVGEDINKSCRCGRRCRR